MDRRTMLAKTTATAGALLATSLTQGKSLEANEQGADENIRVPEQIETPRTILFMHSGIQGKQDGTYPVIAGHPHSVCSVAFFGRDWRDCYARISGVTGIIHREEDAPRGCRVVRHRKARYLMDVRYDVSERIELEDHQRERWAKNKRNDGCRGEGTRIRGDILVRYDYDLVLAAFRELCRGWAEYTRNLYEKHHGYCPGCWNREVQVPWKGYMSQDMSVDVMPPRQRIKNKNAVSCECGWTGIADDLGPRPMKLYPREIGGEWPTTPVDAWVIERPKWAT